MLKHTNLYNSSGKNITLGNRIGCGGEGDVYEVTANAHDIVAKIYHQPVKPEKQQKLKHMVQGCDEQLKKISAWPIDLLHNGPQGSICGFLMPNVHGYDAVHKLYGPAHRKQHFPKADWAFLIHTARNIASAFDVMHSHGHIIGDANPGNIFVADNSTVKLIDCDSFQVNINGLIIPCEVGVSHFTPPEIQNRQSFHNIHRTENHDNFSLALLCFHLLFMGRHPFSCVYSGKEDMPLERAIENYLFAFGKNAYVKKISPPPNCVTMDIVSPSISSLFESSFSKETINNRPKAIEWIKSLEVLRNSLRTCSRESIHKYYMGLTNCPWCEIEAQSGVLFFVGIFETTHDVTSFNIDEIWKQIESIASPGEAPCINTIYSNIKPKPLSKEMEIKKIKSNIINTIIVIISVIVLLGLLFVFPYAFYIYIMAFVGIIQYIKTPFDYSVERTSRHSELITAEQKWKEAEQKWKNETGDRKFREIIQEFSAIKLKYGNLSSEYSKEKQILQNSVKSRQLHLYLEKYFIDDHNISNIGIGRKAVLASYGIETAADIDEHKIRRIKGFGWSLTSDLMNWKKSLESNFKFDPSKGIDLKDIAILNQKYNQLKKQLENRLLGVPELLNKIKNDILYKRQTLLKETEAAAYNLAQARCDMLILK